MRKQIFCPSFMRHAGLCLGIAALGLALSGVTQAAETATAAAGGNWELVWSDEFNYKGLPDTNKWSYEEGFVRNQEPQYYTRDRLENARVEDGCLVIEARQEKFKNPRYNAKSTNSASPASHEFADYTSASVTTWKRAAWQYGRFEIRAKLPTAVGTWPAFWTLGNNRSQLGWPRCGEIDIMEFWGRAPHTMTSCVHYQQDGKHKSSGGRIESKESLADFHVYALDWFPDRMDFLYDGQKYHSVPLSKLDNNGDNAFKKEHYILLNLALESRGKKIDTSSLPQRFVIDYVRIYRQKGAAK